MISSEMIKSFDTVISSPSQNANKIDIMRACGMHKNAIHTHRDRQTETERGTHIDTQKRLLKSIGFLATTFLCSQISILLVNEVKSLSYQSVDSFDIYNSIRCMYTWIECYCRHLLFPITLKPMMFCCDYVTIWLQRNSINLILFYPSQMY